MQVTLLQVKQSASHALLFHPSIFTRFGTSPSTSTSPHWALPELPAVIPHLPAHTCPVPAPSDRRVLFSPSQEWCQRDLESFSPFRGCSRGFQRTVTTLSWNMAPFVPVLSLVGSMRGSRVHPLEKLGMKNKGISQQERGSTKRVYFA